MSLGNRSLTNVRQFNASLRSFSALPRQVQPTVIFVENAEKKRQNNLLGPSNSQFPFPGDVASSMTFNVGTNNKNAVQPATDSQKPKEYRTTSVRALLEESVTAVKLTPGYSPEEIVTEMANPLTEQVEVKALDCPRLLRKDLKHLFPNIDFKDRDVSVLNITQKTENDMSAWSPLMDVERMQLTSGFVKSATSVCSALQQFGYWADFIDPSSGRPYLGDFTNATLFETDERYKTMGFQIEDLGCCKVLRHVLWGTKAFVGTIFTDAPLDCEILQDIVNKINKD
uniref:Methylmalonic aciduria and homocystinuria type D homolog, mitochondrial n=1 Tax=Steinernema glaseri TaxID=37863 RepID=A0A1I7YS85_9BILA